MHRIAPDHGRNDARHLAFRHGALDDLIDPAEHSRVETITVAHAATLLAGPALGPAHRSTKSSAVLWPTSLCSKRFSERHESHLILALRIGGWGFDERQRGASSNARPGSVDFL
jgi:hypothetical protein